MISDLEIAQSTSMKNIDEIAEQLGIPPGELVHFGKYKAKIPYTLTNELQIKKNHLVLVTAMTPTPAGEGKTTVSVALSDALNAIDQKSVVVLREPSMGPVFGIKGGATGGGRAQVVPMEDINLHFTGDFAAVEKAHNLLAALIDNNIQSRTGGLGIDPRTIVWKWVMDMNDRSLRQVITGLGGKSGGLLRESGFDITAASEIMAILCMARNLQDLKDRMAHIYVGDRFDGSPVFAGDFNAAGAMAALMKDAINPNLVQTLEGNPAIIHGGPFANIAQGTNSLIATRMGLSLAKFVVTEAGFGSDLGAEKFVNIKCQSSGLRPKVAVLVATVRALKYHGGLSKDRLQVANLPALELGLNNLRQHIENLQTMGLRVVVAVNRFVTDTDQEVQAILQDCEQQKVTASVCEGWSKGGEGAKDLAEKVVFLAEKELRADFTPTYEWAQSPRDKILAVANKVYGASGVSFSQQAESDLKKAEKLGMGHLPICIAKTQSSFTDDPKRIGAPKNFNIHIREIEFAVGAGFLIPIAGKILRMPGLPAVPSAEKVDIDAEGRISGLF